MGVDFLDFTFRIEKSFGLKIPAHASELLPISSPAQLTAGHLHDWVILLCTRQGMPVPQSSWHRVQKILSEVTGKSPRLIHRHTLVRRDLGFI